MNQSQANKAITVTLPAYLWRRLLYATQCHADDREHAGFPDVAAAYRFAHDAAAKELGVTGSDDLPYVSGLKTADDGSTGWMQ